MKTVSIVMGARGREEHTRRTLQSYTKLSYTDYELLFVDVLHGDINLKKLYEEFRGKLPIRYFSLEENGKEYIRDVTTWTPATTWNYGIRQSTGKFVITCSADVILSYPDMIERFLEQYRSSRISVLTYFLSKEMTEQLSTLDWYNNPDSIQGFTGFWDDMISGVTNRSRLAAGLTTYITGQPREMWEYMGLFREELSHLVNDQDMMLRDVYLGRGVDTLDGYVAYHQAHPLETIGMGVNCASPGWNYHNEQQARLLEPAPRDPA